MPVAGSAGVRSGPSAAAMPNSSNQARVAGGEPRVRIDRVRTASMPPSGAESGSTEWAQKASSVKSASSSVAGAASSRDTSSTSSCRSSRMRTSLYSCMRTWG